MASTEPSACELSFVSLEPRDISKMLAIFSESIPHTLLNRRWNRAGHREPAGGIISMTKEAE